MPLRLPLITEPAPRVLLDGVIDYAGLFPPAAVSLPEAVRQYTRYRGGEQGWMLGRFVCPVGALSDFTRTAEPFLPRDAGALPWRLTVVGSGDHRADQDAVDRFNAHHRWSADDCSAVIDAIETRLVSVSEVGEAHGVFRDALTVYGELPLDDALPSLVAALHYHLCGRLGPLQGNGWSPSCSVRNPPADVRPRCTNRANVWLSEYAAGYRVCHGRGSPCRN